LAAIAWSSHHPRGLIGSVLGALFVPVSLLFPVMATERARIERRHG
jgi:hypothetical protein